MEEENKTLQNIIYTVDTSANVSFIFDNISINSNDFVYTTNTVVYSDPYAQLEEFEQEKENDEKLRSKNPVLQEAYEHYQLIKKLVEDNEIDKSFESRYSGFKEK